MRPEPGRHPGKGPDNNPSHSGVVQLGGHRYAWTQDANGEVALTGLTGMEPYGSLGDMRLNAQDEATLVNALLAQHRANALPNGSQYYAASAVVTDDGHLYLSTNNELTIKDQFAGRGCAESSALRKAQDGLLRPNVQLKSVYLMSGQAERQGEGLNDRQQGHVACLCGEYRDNLREHTGRDTRFIMLPTGGNTQPPRLNGHAQNPAELAPGEAWLIPHEQMYPLPEQQVDEKNGIDHIVRKGYLAVTGDKAMPPLQLGFGMLAVDVATGLVQLHKSVVALLMRTMQQADMSVPGLEINGGLENVNHAMLQLVKKAYKEHEAHIPKGKNLKVTVVVLKTDEGKFYPGVSVEGEGWLPSKPPLFASALANANNHIGFTDVYMMTLDAGQVQAEMQAAHAGARHHRMAMPNSAALGRLLKNEHNGQDARITVLPVNDGTLPQAELERHAFRFSAREMFGPGFSHPKSQFQRIAH